MIACRQDHIVAISFIKLCLSVRNYIIVATRLVQSNPSCYLPTVFNCNFTISSTANAYEENWTSWQLSVFVWRLTTISCSFCNQSSKCSDGHSWIIKWPRCWDLRSTWIFRWLLVNNSIFCVMNRVFSSWRIQRGIYLWSSYILKIFQF